MARNEVALRTAVEQSAAMLTAAGFPRMPARVLMTLLVAEGDGLTAAELAETMEVSAAAISGAVRYLQTVGIVHRISDPRSRRDRYSLPEKAWYTVLTRSNPLYASLATIFDTAAAAIDEPTSAATERLTEMAEFYRFLHFRMPALMTEWDAIRLSE
jgi:DNA-binding transcriptional regulator GbsR (MarR family)